MEREVLTNENIKYDLRNLFIKNFVGGLIKFGVLFLIIVISYSIFSTNFLIFKALFIISIIAYCIVLINYAIYMVKFLIAYLKNKFFILEDTIIGLAENEKNLFYDFKWNRLRLFFGANASTTTLYFKKFGRFLFLEGYHYKWSITHMTDAKGIYNHSSVGDNFYIISFNKKDVLLAYNSKIFKYNKC